MRAGTHAVIYAYLCANIDRDGLCIGSERGPNCSLKQGTAASGDVLQAGRLRSAMDTAHADCAPRCD